MSSRPRRHPQPFQFPRAVPRSGRGARRALECNNCGGSDVACDARVDPDTGAIQNFFDRMDGFSARYGEGEPIEHRKQ